MTKDPEIFLRDILASIKLIEKRIKGVTYTQFVNDVDLQDMVNRRLEIIGEAVRNLSKEFRDRHSDIGWQNPADMRSILIHGYFGVDLKVVWNTVAHDLPSFKEQVQKLLDDLEG